MSLDVPAGPELGARWHSVGAGFVVPDGSHANPEADRQIYYALPSSPSVARDAKGAPLFAVTLVLSRAPRVTESCVHALIEQGVRSLDVELALQARHLDEFDSSLGNEHHAAIEDTVIFPAWKAAIGSNELDAMGEKFEEIEHEQFGEDGFETALKRMEEIEQSLGLSNLDMFTAPPPPKGS